MTEWEIVALADGRFEGPGYGYKLTQGDHLGCIIHYMLVMNGSQEKPLDFNVPCPSPTP